MISDISNINRLIRIETRRAIKAVLESSLSSNSEEERERQKRQKQSIDNRDVKAEDEERSAKDEAEEEGKEKSDSKDAEKREDRTKGKGTADSPKLKQPKESQLQNPNMSAVVDKINALRGGKSLDDPEIKKSFQQYFDSLTLPEKQSLILFLTGISRILAGKEAGASALDPSDAGLRVKKAQKSQTNKKTPGDQDNKTGTEANPIVVGEVASKHMIKKVLKAYRDNT